MHLVGLFGAPRRTAFTTYEGNPDAATWIPYYVFMAIGGTVLFIGVLFMVYNVFALLRAPKGVTEYPIGEAMEQAEATPAYLDRWSVWISLSVVLILVAYTIPLMDMIMQSGVGSKGFVTW